MQTAKQLQAQIKKCEAKAKTCTFNSTRTQWQDKILFLQGELALQIAFAAAATQPVRTTPRMPAHEMEKKITKLQAQIRTHEWFPTPISADVGKRYREDL